MINLQKCFKEISNPFYLVAYAAQRAKDIACGSPVLVERKGDRDSLVALREIGGGFIKQEDLEKNIIKSYQNVIVWSENKDL